MSNYTPLINPYGSEVESEAIMYAFDTSLSIALTSFITMTVIIAIILYCEKKKHPQLDVNKRGCSLFVPSAVTLLLVVGFVYILSGLMHTKAVSDRIDQQNLEAIQSNMSAKYDIKPDAITYTRKDTRPDIEAGIYDLNVRLGEYPTRMTVQFADSGEPFIVIEDNVSKEDIARLKR